MPRDYRGYLTGPEPRRWAPWLLGAAMALALAVAWVNDDEDSVLAGPLALLFGAAIAAQAVDALRTGTLIGIFPNKWPIEACRRAEPISFWCCTVLYALMGLMFFGLGVMLTFEALVSVFGLA